VKEVIKTPFLSRLFPKIMKQEDYEARRKEDVKKIVCSIAGFRGYTTKENLDKKRQNMIFKK
jgi:hypothetical protein